MHLNHILNSKNSFCALGLERFQLSSAREISTPTHQCYLSNLFCLVALQECLHFWAESWHIGRSFSHIKWLWPKILLTLNTRPVYVFLSRFSNIQFPCGTGQIKPKVDGQAVDSPKKRTNEFVFCFNAFHGKKTPNSFVHFLGESTARQSAFGLIWSLRRSF